MGEIPDVIRRTGGWCVELSQPLAYDGRVRDMVCVRKMTASQVFRWGDRQYTSVMALLAELTDLPERLLRELATDDYDRVMLALYNVVPPAMREDFKAGSAPITTPDELLSENEPPPPDPVDWRFPKAEGPVKRYPMQPASAPASAARSIDDMPDLPDMSFDPPSKIMEAG